MTITCAAILLAVGGLFASCAPLTPAQLGALRAIADDAPAPAPAPVIFPDYTADFSPAPNMSFTRPSGPGPVMGCDHCSPYSWQVQQLFDMAAGR